MTATLKRLPLHEIHTQAQGHFSHFGDWEVPLYFSSILDEHEAVRTRAGLFDISHMGEFFIEGRDAKKFLDFLLPRRMDRLENGKALYAPLLNETGGIVDDLIVYQIHPDRFLLIVNAANIDKDFSWIQKILPTSVELDNASEHKSLFALQGPQSLSIAESLFRCGFHSLRYYHFLSLSSQWGELLISRTGYTGEDGFEILLDQPESASLWRAFMETGTQRGLKAIGFGARDTLRLEAGMLLYGQDMDDSTSAVEAGLEWAVDFDKDFFIGKDRNLSEKQTSVSRKLVGFEMLGGGIPRHSFTIEKEGRVIGRVTSGSFAPALKKNIGLGYVSAEASQDGNEFNVVIRGQRVKARVVSLPFYKRASHGISF